MRLTLLNHLASTLEIIPERAILKTLELESHMLKDDLLHDRPVPVDEAQSVLDFYEFVCSVRDGSPVKKVIPSKPAQHLLFFRKTIQRLVAAHELPLAALSQFEEAFSGIASGTAKG